MWKNLKIEWLKIKNYRTFWILLMLYVLCVVGIIYMSYQFKMVAAENSKGAVNMLLGNPFAFPDVWQSVTYVGSYVLFLPGLLMVILITNEYNFKTHRQNVIDGLSRFEFAFSKIVLALILSIVATVVVLLTAIFTGLLVGGGFSMQGIIYVLYFFLQAFTYTMAGLVFGFLLKRSGISIALYLLYIAFIKNIVSALASHYLFSSGAYFPVKASDNLIPLPFLHNVTKQFITQPNVSWLLILTLVYLFAFYIIIIKKYTTQDL